MKKFHIAAILAGLAFSAGAFACPTPGPTCTSTPTTSVTTGVSITGTVNNSIGSMSTSSLGQGGASYAQSSAGVSEAASAFGTVSSNKNSGPNGSIAGGTATNGSAYANGASVTFGTGQAATNAVAYGTGSATTAADLTSKNATGQLNLAGTATSANQVGIGYATQSSGNGTVSGVASVDAATANGFSATGTIAACNTPVNATITDNKVGTTLTNAPVVNTYAAGNASGNAFSPFTNGTTATATQAASVSGSFSAVK